MKKLRHTTSGHGPVNPARRRFVQGLAAGGALASFGFLERPLWALNAPGKMPELRGTEFDLVVDQIPVNFTGSTGVAIGVNGSVPAPVLRWREGDTVTLRVTNRLKQPTSIHWHGIILPFQMDGVPGLTYPGIAPGETFTYRFKVSQSGTYWYHSHSGFQEQQGHYGPLVIEPRERDPFTYDRDYVVMLSDWTDASPDFVFSRLKEMDGYYNYARLTMADFMDKAKKEGMGKAIDERLMWDQMRMNPRDLSDVTGATYTYLMNGATPNGNWTGVFRRGEKVRLRFINGSAMSYFDVRIPGLKMTVVAADGQNVHPVSIDEFRIGVAETYDVLVEPKDDRAYTIFAQALDRSGFARGTLAPREGMTSEVPALDPVPTLTMADMGMSMHGMHMDGMDMGGMDHGQHNMSGMQPDGKDGMSGSNMSGQGMSGTDHSQHNMDMSGMQSDAQGGMSGDSMSGMDHSQHNMNMPGQAMSGKQGQSGGGMMKVTHHPASEYGPGTAMHADEVSTRLDDPGAGLRNNGRRVLTYADLKTIGAPLSRGEPSRTIELHLTGNMERYMWSFDGVKFSDAGPIQLKYGEHVRILLVNDTMMEHPIHLHGMWSEIENPDGSFQVRKHTVSVKPGHAVSYRVYADAIGRWAYHCHLLYHMKAGMFREVRVS